MQPRKSSHMWHRLNHLSWFRLIFKHLHIAGLYFESAESWPQTSRRCRQHDRVYTVCFSLSNTWNVLTTQGSHWFSHTVALVSYSGSHAHTAIFTHFTFATLSVMQTFWGRGQQWCYRETLMQEAQLNLKPMNKSGRTQSVRVRIFPALPSVGREEVEL